MSWTVVLCSVQICYRPQESFLTNSVAHKLKEKQLAYLTLVLLWLCPYLQVSATAVLPADAPLSLAGVHHTLNVCDMNVT